MVCRSAYRFCSCFLPVSFGLQGASKVHPRRRIVGMAACARPSCPFQANAGHKFCCGLSCAETLAIPWPRRHNQRETLCLIRFGDHGGCVAQRCVAGTLCCSTAKVAAAVADDIGPSKCIIVAIANVPGARTIRSTPLGCSKFGNLTANDARGDDMASIGSLQGHSVAVQRRRRRPSLTTVQQRQGRTTAMQQRQQRQCAWAWPRVVEPRGVHTGQG